MRQYPNHTVAKLIVILFLVLVIAGIFMGTDLIVSTIWAVLNAIMPCVVVIGGIYILLRSLFR